VLDISVEGTPDAWGQIVRRDAIDQLVGERILHRIDHRNLNMDVPELAARVPTTENLALAIREMLERDWPFEARLAGVRVAETDRNIFELETR
jgi:6-pyruvoyltetrahydropterin/6-carboxytetrahydropterin synthase